MKTQEKEKHELQKEASGSEQACVSEVRGCDPKSRRS